MIFRRMATMTMLFFGIVCAGCLRPPIRDDRGDGAGGSEDTGASEDTGTADRAEDTGGVDDDSDDDPSTGTAEDTTSEPEPNCHPSYEPCLPVAPDLNCPQIIELGLAPVTLIGPDDYGLDSDNDGIGCED